MRPKSLLLLGLALGCGLVASIGISQVMDRSSQPHVKFETVPIYVALHNINLGDPIGPDMISLQEWPKDKVPRGAISTLEDLEGRRPRTAIFEGEPILEAKLLARGQIADPIRSIPKGMRLKTIAVDAEKSAAGLLGPGDRVDVQLYVRRDQRTGIQESKAKIILQNIRVFAVDQAVQRTPDGAEDRTIAKTVSLMLTPEQASKISLAEQIGEISLIPRNPDDEATADWNEYTIEDLLADGETGSREKEQGRDDDAEESSDSSALVSAIRDTEPPEDPPFRMEIVEAQDIREVLFDAASGKPIRGTTSSSIAPSAAPTMPEMPSESEPEPGKTLDDFPIDFTSRR